MSEQREARIAFHYAMQVLDGELRRHLMESHRHGAAAFPSESCTRCRELAEREAVLQRDYLGGNL